MKYCEKSKEELLSLKNELVAEYEGLKALGLKLDMSRGKPAPSQVDISDGILTAITDTKDTRGYNGVDYRNYGILEGIPEIREMFGEVFGVPAENVIACGNSSLNLMYDAFARAYIFGLPGAKLPWGKQEKLKWLCPVPGYDRHFAISERFGFEMINIEMTPEGPDMDKIEELVANDETIKGIWCVPKYSNPQGITYSDETVRRLAALKPKADDFRIFWDNAYYIHPISEDEKLLNIYEEAQKAGNEDIFFEFASTSKVTYPGGGVAFIFASKNNIDYIKKQMTIQTISFDKIHQLRHVKFFKNAQNVIEHMKKHGACLKPKFDAVCETFEKEFSGLGIAEWINPNGGYFISLDILDGTAKRTHALAKEAGVTLTTAGATYPYGNDPRDRNLRIAPSYPTPEELKQAIGVLCVCVKLAAVEKLLETK